MKEPEYISSCLDDDSLGEHLKHLLEIIDINIKTGYLIDKEHILDIVDNGLCLNTYNMFLINLNIKLNQQYLEGNTNLRINTVSPSTHQIH